MPAPRTFSQILAEGLTRNLRAGDAVRKMHAKQPFTDRSEIEAAFYMEMARLHACEFTEDDRTELHQMGIADAAGSPLTMEMFLSALKDTRPRPKSNLIAFPSTN